MKCLFLVTERNDNLPVLLLLNKDQIKINLFAYPWAIFFSHTHTNPDNPHRPLSSPEFLNLGLIRLIS